MTGTEKNIILVDFGTLQCLNKYLFRETVCNDILERLSENMYSVENIDCESRSFIIHEPYLFIKREGLKVIFH